MQDALSHVNLGRLCDYLEFETVKSLIRRILRGLRSVLRAISGLAAYSFSFAHGVLYGAFRRSEMVIEPEEILETELEESVAPEPVASPIPEGTVAQRVKNAILALDAGRPVDAEFDLGKPEHVLARDWFKSLDESGLRALRHMPMSALGAHLNPRYSVRAAGLPRYPLTANRNAPALAAEASGNVDFKMAVRQARP
jgi:hypothetical protein